MCIDLREPNKAVVVDSHPLPHIEELLAELRGATVFSTIDLASAYHQVPLHPESRDLTAFITHDGLFRYKRVPYGLASAAPAFQKMMMTILHGLSGVQAYLDDLIVYGNTEDIHDTRLKAVLHGLKLNMQKCKFKMQSLKFLGHTISKDGLHPDPDNVAAVMHAPAPHDMASLRSFLGLTSWYSKFLPDYATEVEPLREVLRTSTDTNFLWTDKAAQSFATLKTLLSKSPILALFDPRLPTYVSTDASDYGVGGVLSQLHADGTERIVAFASRTLSSAERKYSTVEREALACVWCVEKWRTYLWGRHFVLRTDHQALTTLLTSKGTGRAGLRIARWSARLLCYSYDVAFRPGRYNTTADCLSRLPLPVTSDLTDEPEMVATVSHLPALSASEFASASESCLQLTQLREQIQNGWPKNKKSVKQELEPYFHIRHELSVEGPLIMRGDHCLVVPLSLRTRLVNLAHEGHQGIVRTKQRLRELYWWPQMGKNVETLIASCVTCQLNDKTAKPAPAPIIPVELPNGPWQKVAIDIVGPFESATWDCRYAITLVDYYSKWPEVAFASHVTTDVITTFLDTIFSREGNPYCLVPDNGAQLTSTAFADFLEERNIQHVYSSVYYPQANGAVERFNKVLKQCIQSAIQEKQPWKAAVTQFLHNFRATPHATTGATPFELLRGRKMRTKLDVLPVSMRAKTRSEISDTVARKQQKCKDYTDKKRGARVPTFKEKDWVRIKKPEHVRKGSSKYTAPCLVKKRVGPNTVLLEDGKKWNASRLTGVPNEVLLSLGETPEGKISVQHHAHVNEQQTSPRRSVRVPKQPVWLKDFVLEK
nr:uncharacterized protein K02A2.6-like [Misgurnus anguillicaudatus]